MIGYTPGGTCEPIGELSTPRPILEWLGMADDELLLRDYDGFVDMNASSKAGFTLSTPHSTVSANTDLNLIFAGAFDSGSEEISACSGAFGWHGADSNLSFDIDMSTADKIVITDTTKKPDFIYEKYYLSKTAYAIARGADTDLNSTCITDLNNSVDENTLFLFYDYQPYKGENFCGDGGVGSASILAQDVTAFTAEAVNDIIRLSIDMKRDIRGRSCGVHVSKQKAVF